MKFTCRDCKRIEEVPVTNEQLMRWRGGALIQNVVPELTPDQREIMISGICGRCFDRMFKPQEEEEDGTQVM